MCQRTSSYGEHSSGDACCKSLPIEPAGVFLIEIIYLVCDKNFLGLFLVIQLVVCLFVSKLLLKLAIEVLLCPTVTLIKKILVISWFVETEDISAEVNKRC